MEGFYSLGQLMMFWVIALVAWLILLIQLVITVLGLGDRLDLDHSTGGLRIISLRSITDFFRGFGWTWLPFTRRNTAVADPGSIWGASNLEEFLFLRFNRQGQQEEFPRRWVTSESEQCGLLAPSLRKGILVGTAVLWALLPLTACSQSQGPRPDERSVEKKHRLILCNDGGSLSGPVLEAPIGVEGLVQLAIEPLQDTLIDTLYWQLGTDPYLGSPTARLSDYYSHQTQVGPIWGSEGSSFPSAGLWRTYENARQLMEQGTDPVAVVVEHGHRAGLEVFLSMRVNDIHDRNLEGGTQDPLISPTKRDHPEWLLGEKGPYKTSYNFALPEVRDYKLALAQETIENYDLDGLDWDFCRHRYLFPQGQESQGGLSPVGPGEAGLLTELLGQIKEALDQKSAKVGRRLSFSVRVTGSLDEALAQGMDVRTWLSEGLIDILIVGHHSNRHRLPLEEYVAAARGTQTQIIAQGLGLFQQPRSIGLHGTVESLSARLIWREKDYYSTEMCRAVAAAHWRAGAEGIYLFNNHRLQEVRDRDYDRLPWKEIGDPDLIARKDKHYLADQKGGLGPLPLELAGVGDEARVSVDVADDLDSAVRDGALREASLRLLVDHLTSLDRLEIRLNGELLEAPRARWIFFNETWLEFDVGPPPLKQGWNQISAVVQGRNPHVTSPLALKSVEIVVRYHGS